MVYANILLFLGEFMKQNFKIILMSTILLTSQNYVLAQSNNNTTTSNTNQSKEISSTLFAPLKEGKDFLKIKLNDDTSSNINEINFNEPTIVDFFWYGCGHCNAMRPLIGNFIKENPSTPHVTYPVSFPNWIDGTKMYFAYKNLGVLDKLHNPTFEAIHVKRLNLFKDKEVFNKFLKENNLDQTKYQNEVNSFQLSQQLLKAGKITANYKIESTPTMGVTYKGYAYLTNPGLTGSYEKTITTLSTILKTVEKNK